jgi:hypothetical protein
MKSSSSVPWPVAPISIVACVSLTELVKAKEISCQSDPANFSGIDAIGNPCELVTRKIN